MVDHLLGLIMEKVIPLKSGTMLNHSYFSAPPILAAHIISNPVLLGPELLPHGGDLGNGLDRRALTAHAEKKSQQPSCDGSTPASASWGMVWAAEMQNRT